MLTRTQCLQAVSTLYSSATTQGLQTQVGHQGKARQDSQGVSGSSKLESDSRKGLWQHLRSSVPTRRSWKSPRVSRPKKRMEAPL